MFLRDKEIWTASRVGGKPKVRIELCVMKRQAFYFVNDSLCFVNSHQHFNTLELFFTVRVIITQKWLFEFLYALISDAFSTRRQQQTYRQSSSIERKSVFKMRDCMTPICRRSLVVKRYFYKHRNNTPKC